MKNFMLSIHFYPLFLVFSIAFCITFSGCTATASEDNSTEPVERSKPIPNSHLLVFIDKTISNSTNSQVLANQEKDLRRQIREHLKTNGDFMGAYTIHSSTGPGSSIIQVKLNEKADTLGLGVGAQTKQERISDLKMRIDGKVKSCYNGCRKELTNQNTQTSNQQTDLWATLNLIGKHTASLPKQDKVTVIYISDMIESMNGNNRRDFHKNPIGSPAEAIKLANEDLKNIRASYLTAEPAIPENVTVKIWLPYGSHATNNAANMVAYWEEIFRQLGIKTELANS